MVEKMPLEKANSQSAAGELAEMLGFRAELEDVCASSAERFGLSGRDGKPRVALVMDALLKYPCLDRVVKHLGLDDGNVNLPYRENRSLAINLLTGCLQAKIAGYAVEVEVDEECGGPDATIRPMKCGIMVRSGTATVLVEVKGGCFTYSQLIRHLIDRSDAITVVWRILLKQIFTVDSRKHMWLFLESMRFALNRGQALLSGYRSECSHKIGDVDAFVNGFLSALRATLPTDVDEVCLPVRDEGPNGR